MTNPSSDKKSLYDFFMQAPAAMAILKGPDHLIEFMNKPCEELIGKGDLVGKTVREAIPEIEGQGFLEMMDSVYRTGEPIIAKEARALLDRGNGYLEEIFVDLNYQAHKDAAGQTQGVLVFSYDITEHVMARRAAEDNLVRTKFMTNSLPQKVFTADAEGNVNFCNQRWIEFTGRTFVDLKEWGWTDIIHPDDLDENIRIWKVSIANGTDFSFSHRFRNRAGDYRWHLSTATAQKDEEGNVLMWMGVNSDVHDLKVIQEELERSYQDLEVKVKFRNLELEQEVRDLQKKLDTLSRG